MASKSSGSIFRRTDGKCFIYLPKALVEDTGFPFPVSSKVKVRVHFKPGDKRLIIE